VHSFSSLDHDTAHASGAEYVSTVRRFCTSKCTAAISKYSPYFDVIHITSIWAIYLQNVLPQALGISEDSRVSVSILPKV
jgi:hypothetical protein